MKRRKNLPRTVYPCVKLGPKKVIHPTQIPRKAVPLSKEEEKRDARATQHIRQVLLEINKKKDGQQAFFLLANFFSNHPVETLGPRAAKEIALSLSRGEVPMDNFKFLLGVCEIALVHHHKAEALCEKLRHVGFPQNKKGLKRARNLHFALRFWEGSLLTQKNLHGLAA